MAEQRPSDGVRKSDQSATNREGDREARQTSEGASSSRPKPARRRRGRRRHDRSTATTSNVGASGSGFQSLYFGMAAAENEVARDPERFLRTYFNPWDIVRQVDVDRHFLI